MRKAAQNEGAAGNGAVFSVLDADRARRIGIEFCLFHYPTLYTAGTPQPTHSEAWLVPVILEDPDGGISQRVGELIIQKDSGKVTNHTPSKQIVAEGKKLYSRQKNARAGANSPKKK